MSAIDDEDLYDEFDGLPDPGVWINGNPPVDRNTVSLETLDDETIEDDRLAQRRPLEASEPTRPSGNPSIWGPGYEQSKGGSGFDWRRMFVGAAKQDLAQYDRNKLLSEQGPQIEEQRRTARARLDPASPESKRAQEDFAAQLRLYALNPSLKNHPDMLKELEGVTGSLPRMSAADIERAAPRYERVFGTAMRGVHEEGLTARSSAALQQRKDEAVARAKRAAEERGFDYASLDERIKSRLEMAAQREMKRDESALAAYGKDAGDLETAEQILGSVTKTLGDTKTGWVPDKWNKAAQFLGFGNVNWDTAQSALQSIKNRLRHDQFGGALTPVEAEEFEKDLPGFDMPRATFDAKLAEKLRYLRTKIEEMRRKNPRGAAAADRNAKPAATAPVKAPPGAKPGDRVRRKSDGAILVVQPDGTMIPE